MTSNTAAGPTNATTTAAAAAAANTSFGNPQQRNTANPPGILKSTINQQAAGATVGNESNGKTQQPAAVVGFRSNNETVGKKEQRIQNDFDEMIRQERQRELERRKHVPTDLGKDVYKMICDNFKEKKQLSIKDPQVLFDFWKVLNKAERQNSYRGEVVKPLTEREAKKMNVYELSLYKRKERKFNMSVLARAHPLDVKLTLETHHEEAKHEIEKVKEQQYQRRLELAEAKQKENDEYIREKKNQQQQRMIELMQPVRAVDESYESEEGEDGDEIDQGEEDDYFPGEEGGELTPQQLEEQAKERARIETQIREAFVEMVIVLFRKRYPMQRVYKNQEDLIQFWEEEIPDKREKNLDVSQEQAQKYIDDYFFFKGLDFFLMRRARIGYDTFDQDELIEFYLTLTKGEKKRRGLQFDSESDVVKMIAYYLQRAKKQNEEVLQQQVKVEEKKVLQMERLKAEVLQGKEISATDLNTLSMAKDRLLVGKSLLQLRHQYPQDKILRKMILDEFQENKVAKHPLEYDTKDEVTESKIQGRQLIEVQHNTRRSLRLSDLNAPLNERTKIIASLFEEEIENYYYHMEDRVKQSQRAKTEIEIQMKDLKRFLEQEAQRFIQLRKRRYTQPNIPSVNQFLSQLYREAADNDQFSKALNKHFPHSTAGQSKQLAQVSFPYSFKRFFFEVVRSYAADLHKDAVTKLPFWAPSGKNYRTLNYKVKKLSRDAKNQQRWEKYCDRMNAKRVWDNTDLMSQKLKVMMTFEEAKECTFEPMVGLRSSLEMRSLLKSGQLEYGQQVHDLLFSRQPNFEKWIERMGPDFRVKFPQVIKFGIYRRCLRHLSQREFTEAATLLFENFSVEAIRNFFNQMYKDTIRTNQKSQQTEKPSQPIIYTVDRCTPDQDKMKHVGNEDFESDTNRKFLEDVYFMVIVPLDKYVANLDKDLKSLDQVKKNQEEYQQSVTQKRSSTFDASLNERIVTEEGMVSSYQSRSQNPKSIMCPLKEKCPNVLNNRWPKGNMSNSIPQGANCEYAHSYAELKFVQEKKAKVKALTQRIEVIQKQLQTGTDPLASMHWNPANNLFVKCTGCSTRAGACSLCQMKETNNKRIQELKASSNAAYQRLSQTKGVQQKQEVKQKLYEAISFKISSLQRANILYSKERFSEAFDVISKAAVFVKDELAAKELVNQENQVQWSKKLNLPLESAKTLQTQGISKTDKNAASMALLASKTGLGRPGSAAAGASNKIDNDEFLNYQIQLLYLKVEKALGAKKKDIHLMQSKIEKLENAQQQESQHKQSQPSASPATAAQQLKKKHVDLVSNERKIRNLQNAIEKTQQSMLNSTSPASWNPTSAVDAILDIDHLNEANLSKNIHSISVPQKSIYNRTSQDLRTNPLHRATKDDFDDNYSGSYGE